MGLFGSKKASAAASAHAERLVQMQSRIDALPTTYPDGLPIHKAQLVDAYVTMFTYIYEVKCEQKNDPRWIQSANYDAERLIKLLDGLDYPGYGRFSALNRRGGSTIKDTLEDQIMSAHFGVESLSGSLKRTRKVSPEPFLHSLAVMAGACAHALRTSGVGETFINSRTMKGLESQ